MDYVKEDTLKWSNHCITKRFGEKGQEDNLEYFQEAAIHLETHSKINDVH